MKNTKKVLSMLLCMVFVMSTSAFAAETAVITEGTDSIYIANGEITNNEELQSVIDEYFSARESVLKPAKNSEIAYIQDLNSIVDTTNNSLMLQEKERVDARENMAYYHGEYVVDSQSIPTVERVTPIEVAGYDEAYEVKVYEWTWVDYNDGKGGPVDRMGYATDHEMVIAVDDNGEAVVVSNEYDDSMFTGVPDVVSESTTNQDTAIAAENEISPLAVSTINMDVNEIIEYADKWVGRTNLSGGSGTSSNYNPAYVNFASDNADCANYVSQCLRAGGMTFDYGANGTKGASDSDDWWYDGSRSGSKENKSAISWRYVPSMINYWNKVRGCSYVSATKTNVYPGNPVFHSGTGGYNHVGICVGYNYNDVPIINAHTSDVYHVPYTHFTSPKTIQIFTSNRLTTKPSSATSITPSATLKTIQKSLSAGNNAYFKISHPSSKTSSYSIKLGSTCDSSSFHMYVYQQKRNDSYMYELKHASGKDVSFTLTVNPNYNYYIRCYVDVPSGTNGVTLSYKLN